MVFLDRVCTILALRALQTEALIVMLLISLGNNSIHVGPWILINMHEPPKMVVHKILLVVFQFPFLLHS